MRRVVLDFIASTPDLETAGSARTGEEALEELAATEADLALIDMSLPGMSGAELVAEVRVRWPDLPCLVLSAHVEAQYVTRALAAGAQGYVLKGDPYQLSVAIRQVLGGEVYLSKSVRRPN